MARWATKNENAAWLAGFADRGPGEEQVRSEWRAVFARAGWVVAAALSAPLADAGPRGFPCPAQVEQEPNGSPATATPIALHDPAWGMFSGIRGAIAAAGDVDWYQLSAPAGARLSLAVDTGVASAGSRDSVVAVFGPDGTTVLESDDDDGTGNGRDYTVESWDASLIAGLVLPAAGTYFVRVQAGSPDAVIDRYVLLLSVSSLTPAMEQEPNDTPPGQVLPAGPVLGSLAGASDVDWYAVAVLDFGIPFVVVDADPERNGGAADLTLRFDSFTPGETLTADSSGLGSPGDPAAEGFAISGLGAVRVSGSGPGTYLLGIWYSGESCEVPVELASFRID